MGEEMGDMPGLSGGGWVEEEEVECPGTDETGWPLEFRPFLEREKKQI